MNGLAFDSVKEARRYGELVLLQRAGEISDLRRQVKYTLIPRQTDENGKILEREVGYVADFTYIENASNLPVVEDVKGIRTKEYIIKRKLMLWVHGIRVREV